MFVRRAVRRKIDRERRDERRGAEPEQQSITRRMRVERRKPIGAGGLAQGPSDGERAPRRLLLAPVGRHELARAAQDERGDARHIGADDEAREIEDDLVRRQRQRSHHRRLHDEGDPDRGGKADAVGDAAEHHGAAQRANAEQDPVMRAGGDAFAEAARDEIGQKHHVRHEADGVQRIGQSQAIDSARSGRFRGRRGRFGHYKSAPGGPGERERRRAQIPPTPRSRRSAAAPA